MMIFLCTVWQSERKVFKNLCQSVTTTQKDILQAYSMECLSYFRKQWSQHKISRQHFHSMGLQTARTLC